MVTFRHVCYTSNDMWKLYSLHELFLVKEYTIISIIFVIKNSEVWRLFFLRSRVFIQALCEKMSNNNIPDLDEQKRQLLARLWDGLKRKGDGKCYCPCSQCRGFKMRRIKIATSRKHCREHGHVVGEHEYCLFVSVALYMFLY